MAAVIILAFWVGWAVWTRDFTLFIRIKDMDIMTDLREDFLEMANEIKPKKTWANLPKRIMEGLI